MPHTCHAIGCEAVCPPAKLMCPAHWRLVPGLVRAAVYATYRPGQETTKHTTQAYRQAAARAIIAVAEQEDQPIADVWRRMAQAEEA